jgi:hypothetical protein
MLLFTSHAIYESAVDQEQQGIKDSDGLNIAEKRCLVKKLSAPMHTLFGHNLTIRDY